MLEAMFDHEEMQTSAELVDVFASPDIGATAEEWDVDGGYLGDAIARPSFVAARPSREWRDQRPVHSPPDSFGQPDRSAAPTAEQSIEQLQSRIRQMQGTRLDTRSLPTHPAIASMLPGGGLKQGAAYSVERSATLLMALLAGPSAAGSWCGVVGVPEFGAEAASTYGIDLDRLVLVPHPGDQWLAVTAAIADVLTVVVTRPPKTASDGTVARLAARLRQRGSTLIVLGTWPQTEAMLSISRSRWTGIGDGHGYLASREVTVTVSSRTSARPRSANLLLPDDLIQEPQQIPTLVPQPVAQQPVAPQSVAPVAAATQQQSPQPVPSRAAPQSVPLFEEAMAG